MFGDYKPKNPDYSTSETFIRDQNNNIKTSIYIDDTTKPQEKVQMNYEYDNKPNPFFKLGVDRYGSISINSLTPNNITKVTYTDKDGRSQIENYSYLYYPNGYPSQVTVTYITDNNASPVML